MALSEIEMKHCEAALSAFIEKRRPPAHLRSQLDLAYRIERQSVEILEIRADWRNPARKIERPVAKATFVRSQNVWRIFWQRADLKWHRYDPDSGVDRIEDVLRVIDIDEFGCFFG
ncbi:DUF3024 domain-containing protein [bacterium]|nr:DUF3024 domain-containing protein [bacterium]